MKVLRDLNEGLFGFVSPVTMGVMRMVTGTLALVNFLMLSIDFEAWFTDKGFTPAWHATRWADSVPRLNLLEGVTDSRVTFVFFVLACVAALFTAIGLWSRVSSIALFVLIATFHHRNPMILHSGDTLLRQMAFIVMLSPSGAACSVDRLVGLWKGTASLIPAMVSAWPQRLMQFQVTVVYFTTVWHKWTGTDWQNGTATWFVPQLHEFDRFPAPAFMDQQPMVAITTYGTLLVELGIAFLAYAKPLRKWVLWGGVLLHAGIEYRFNIPLFAFIMVSTYLAFFEGSEVSAWAKRLGARFKSRRVLVLMAKGGRLSETRGSFLRGIDAFGLLDYQSGEGDELTAMVAGRDADPYRAILNRAPGVWVYKLLPRRWRKLVDGAMERGDSVETPPFTVEAVKS